MGFSASEFVFAFLPAVIFAYLALAWGTRGTRFPNLILLGASLLFYFWGSGALIGLLLAVIGITYGVGLLLCHPNRSAKGRLWTLWFGIAFNLAALVYFKYANFLVDQANGVAAMLGAGSIGWAEVALPIGISFFVFQAISYLIDVYREDAPPARSLADFALYIASFPQLVAGPIVRYGLVAKALAARSTTMDDVVAGSARFVHGLLKKVLIADTLGSVADHAFATSTSLSSGEAWIGLLAYTLQIYFDFSAYSDMAIGLGRIFGFRFPENFARPYSAASVTEFWRRWHMTLSNYFRDYVYIPLGGSRTGPGRTYANLVGVFLLTGIWHGASWNFVLWGVLHGSYLIVERLLGIRQNSGGIARIFGRIATLLLVMLAWVTFRAEDLPSAVAYYTALFDWSHVSIGHEFLFVLDNKAMLALVLGSFVFLLPAGFAMGPWLEKALDSERSTPIRTDRRPAAAAVAGFAYVSAASLITLTLVTAQTFSPFLYFQF